MLSRVNEKEDITVDFKWERKLCCRELVGGREAYTLDNKLVGVRNVLSMNKRRENYAIP